MTSVASVAEAMTAQLKGLMMALHPVSPLISRLGVVAVVYTVSVLLAMWSGPPSKAGKGKAPPAWYSYCTGVLAMVLAGAVMHVVTGSEDAVVYGAVGALVMYQSVMVHHPSTALLVFGAAIQAVLADAEGYHLPSLRGVLAFNTSVYVLSTLACQRVFVAMFGPGVTLFSMAVFALLGAVALADAAHATTVSTVLLLGAPFFLLMTGHPEYLHGRPHTRTILAALGGCAGSFAVWCLHTDTPVLLLSAMTCVVLAGLLGVLDRRPAVLGPFYAMERRGSVLAMLGLAMSAFDLATREEGAVSLPPTPAAPTGAPAPSGRMLLSLFYTVCGYGVGTVFLAACTLALHAFRPRSSGSYRGAALDLGAVVVMGLLAAWVLLTFSELPQLVGSGSRVLWELGQSAGAAAAAAVEQAQAHPSIVFVSGLVAPFSSTLASALAALAAALPAQLTSRAVELARGLGSMGRWPPAWHLAAATTLLHIGSAFVLRALGRTTSLLAPLLADCATAGSPGVRCAALTFDGDLDPATTPALLALLAAAGAKATFFISGDTARHERLLAHSIAAGGHELGVAGPPTAAGLSALVSISLAALGLSPGGAGAGSVSAAIDDALETIRGEVLAPLVRAAAHAPEAARADALLRALGAADAAAAASGGGTAGAGAGGARSRRGRSVGPSGNGNGDGASGAPSPAQSLQRKGRGGTPKPSAPSAAAPGPGPPGSSARAPWGVAWYRPADGSRNAGELRSANVAGLGVALWSACPYDWDASPSQVRARLERQWDAANSAPGDVTQGAAGAIVELHTSVPVYLAPPAAAHKPRHDVVASTAAVLEVLAQRGVRAVTLSELLPLGAHEGGPGTGGTLMFENKLEGSAAAGALQ